MFQNSRCAQTGLPLELPAVHFLCGHSFNRSALGDYERDCPLCADEFRQVSDIRRSLLAGASEQVRPVLQPVSAPCSAWVHGCCAQGGGWGGPALGCCLAPGERWV